MKERLTTMSEREIKRLSVIQNIRDKTMQVREGAKILRLSERHVKRLTQRFRENGPDGLISKRRGVPSNRKHDPKLRT